MCSENTSRTTFPLCTACKSALFSAPSLCEKCGSTTPDCRTRGDHQDTPHCIRPWREVKGIASYSSRYLMISHTHQVLRQWKKKGGVLFSKQIFSPSDRLIQEWKNFRPDLIVPIPQSYERAWKLGGSRTEEICDWISNEIEIPWASLIKINPKKSQAKLDVWDRMRNGNRFELKSTPLIGKFKNIILVDDFITTGKTIRDAAQILLSSGVESVHCFSLGIRPDRPHLK